MTNNLKKRGKFAKDLDRVFTDLDDMGDAKVIDSMIKAYELAILYMFTWSQIQSAFFSLPQYQPYPQTIEALKTIAQMLNCEFIMLNLGDAEGRHYQLCQFKHKNEFAQPDNDRVQAQVATIIEAEVFANLLKPTFSR